MRAVSGTSGRDEKPQNILERVRRGKAHTVLKPARSTCSLVPRSGYGMCKSEHAGAADEIVEHEAAPGGTVVSRCYADEGASIAEPTLLGHPQGVRTGTGSTGLHRAR